MVDNRLPGAGSRRIVVVTGARQVGETTLARAAYLSLRYLNLDSIEQREALRRLPTAPTPGACAAWPKCFLAPKTRRTRRSRRRGGGTW